MNAVASEAVPAKTARKKTEYETVQAEDGKEEQFAGERMINRTFSVDEGAGSASVRLAFRNSRVISYTVGPEDKIDGQSAVLRFAAHGLIQKLGDEAAGAKSVDDAVEWIENLVDQLRQGKWSEGRAPGSGEAGASVLAQAIFIMREETGRPLTREKVREYLRTKTQKEKLQLRGNPKISAIIKRLEEEAGKASPEDAEKLADELEAL